MPMSNDGLTKLIEECGELIQVAAKFIAYPDGGEHPDGAGDLTIRLEEEMADVLAACRFVRLKKLLNYEQIVQRIKQKAYTFERWDNEPNS